MSTLVPKYIDIDFDYYNSYYDPVSDKFVVRTSEKYQSIDRELARKIEEAKNDYYNHRGNRIVRFYYMEPEQFTFSYEYGKVEEQNKELNKYKLLLL